MPPTLTTKPVSDNIRAWRGETETPRKRERTIGPMALQQQQKERLPQQQRLLQQRGGSNKAQV